MLEVLVACLVAIGIWFGLITVIVCKEFMALMKDFVAKIAKIEDLLEEYNEKVIENRE